MQIQTEQQAIEQDEVTEKLSNIYAYLEPHIAPNDQALVRWAFGINEKHSKWDDLQEPLFIG